MKTYEGRYLEPNHEASVFSSLKKRSPFVVLWNKSADSLDPPQFFSRGRFGDLACNPLCWSLTNWTYFRWIDKVKGLGTVKSGQQKVAIVCSLIEVREELAVKYNSRAEECFTRKLLHQPKPYSYAIVLALKFFFLLTFVERRYFYSLINFAFYPLKGNNSIFMMFSLQKGDIQPSLT